MELDTINLLNMIVCLHFQVVTQTITRDLADINSRVKEASTDLRRERVRLITERVKQVKIDSDFLEEFESK